MSVTAIELDELTDDELGELTALFDGGELAEVAAGVLEQRTQAPRRDRRRERWELVRAEWHDAAYADYLLAEQECRGELVNRAGVRAGVRDGFTLWSGPRRVADAYATDELKEFWLEHPRITVTEYAEQRTAGMRAARLERQAAKDITITTEGITDEHVAEVIAEHVAEVVAGHDAAPVRHAGAGSAADPVCGAGRVRELHDTVRPSGREMISFAEVAPRDALLLSRRPYIVYGDLALVYGAGSLGKGRLINAIVAGVTNGAPVGLDEDTLDDPGDVVVILPEDRREESAVKRLIAAGADLSRVWDMTRFGDGTRFKLSAAEQHPGHLPELRAAVEQLRADGRNPRLVVIDPIGACVGWGTILTSKGARLFIERLQDFAEAAGVAVILVAHPTSAGKLQGSHALEQALRTVFHVTRDPEDASTRILSCVKGNDVPPEYAADIRFTIVDSERGPRAEWLHTARPQAQRQDWRDELAAKRARNAQSSPAPAAGPSYTITVASGGTTRLLARDVKDLAMAQSMCAATPEGKAFERARMPLRWLEAEPGLWQAGNRVMAFAIIDASMARRAV